MFIGLPYNKFKQHLYESTIAVMNMNPQSSLKNKKKPRSNKLIGAFLYKAAVTYSPTQSPMQYHRRWRA